MLFPEQLTAAMVNLETVRLGSDSELRSAVVLAAPGPRWPLFVAAASWDW